MEAQARSLASAMANCSATPSRTTETQFKRGIQCKVVLSTLALEVSKCNQLEVFTIFIPLQNLVMIHVVDFELFYLHTDRELETIPSA